MSTDNANSNAKQRHHKYLFISYAHADSARVLPMIERLRREFHVWYDEGIPSSRRFHDVIAERVLNCSCFIAFLTKNYDASTYCCDEYFYAAEEKKKPVIPLFLEKDPFAPASGLHMSIRNNQGYMVEQGEFPDALFVDRLLQPTIKYKHRFWFPPQSKFGQDNPRPFSQRSDTEPMLTLWGPSRPTYHYGEYPADHSLNACVDHPVYGDERRFATVREVGTDEWSNGINLVPGRGYEARIRYRCHGAPEQNPTGKGIANGLKAAAYMPEVVFPHRHGVARFALTETTRSTDMRQNKEREIWSCLHLYADDAPLFLEYVPGSAKIHNRGRTDGMALTNRLFEEEGVYLGVNVLDGRLPSGDDYAGSVTFEFRVHAFQGDCSIERCATANDDEWETNLLEARPGDTITFRTSFRCETNAELSNVTFLDELPDSLVPKKGTTTLHNNSNPSGKLLADSIASKGINTGRYSGVGAYATIEYQVELPSCSGPTNYVTTSHVYHNGGQRSSEVVVHVK